jgi:hypothetical protein
VIKIGERSLKTSRPADLDAIVHALTGCSVAEVRGHLNYQSQPAAVAKLLRPFLGDDAPPPGELGAMIADAGPGLIALAVEKLYAAADEPKSS